MKNGILCGGGNSSGNNPNLITGNGVGSIIGPRIRQLQQQLNIARNSKPSKQTLPPPLMAVQNFGPKGSLVWFYISYHEISFVLMTAFTYSE